jgi:signal transduction histidine kinase
VDLRRLKWVFLAALALFLAVVEWARMQLDPYLISWKGRLLLAGVEAMCIVFLVGAAFTVLSRMQDRLARRNRELLALDRAARDIYGELSIETILQKVIDQARLLLEARYGAIAVVDASSEIRQFLTSGLDDETGRRIGEPPQGKGLLGVVLNNGEILRLDDLEADPRAAGLPPHHPKMKSLLAVPIACESPFKGNIYLTDKLGAGSFSWEDEETLERFALTAGVAIDNFHLHRQLQSLAVAEERSRIGREMHDGMAQVLAYVNAKAQTVGEYLRSQQTDKASDQLRQLAAAAREAYADVREGILALRTQAGSERSFSEALREFFERWQERSGVDGSLVIESGIELSPDKELQLLRMTQEALTNVRKHAQATRVDVKIVRDGATLVTTIEDNGVGFSPEALRRSQFPRFGLTIMKERVESIGGTLGFEQRTNGGTRVRIKIPLDLKS